MSSPAPSNDGEASKSNLEQITFRFCSECSNMLYPKEDEDAHKLQFTCRTCQYTEEATSSCVFRNVMNNAAGETAGVTQDVGSDPTVRDAPSPTQSSLLTPADENLAVCLKCGVTLLHCNQCKDPATVQEYNKFVSQNPDFALNRTLGALHFASYMNTLDDREKAVWIDRFVSSDTCSITGPPQETLASLLHIDISFMDTDADPPEALENPTDEASMSYAGFYPYSN